MKKNLCRILPLIGMLGLAGCIFSSKTTSPTEIVKTEAEPVRTDMAWWQGKGWMFKWKEKTQDGPLIFEGTARACELGRYQYYLSVDLFGTLLDGIDLNIGAEIPYVDEGPKGDDDATALVMLAPQKLVWYNDLELHGIVYGGRKCLSCNSKVVIDLEYRVDYATRTASITKAKNKIMSINCCGIAVSTGVPFTLPEPKRIPLTILDTEECKEAFEFKN